MNLQSWNNGDGGAEIRKIVEKNFSDVSRYISKYIMVLSTTERMFLSSDYLNDKLIVYDKDLNEWFQYTGVSWAKYSFPNESSTSVKKKTIMINKSDWSNGQIKISYSSHGISEPTVQLYMLNNSNYEIVIGDVCIDSSNNITLSSDISFQGKVVIV